MICYLLSFFCKTLTSIQILIKELTKITCFDLFWKIIDTSDFCPTFLSFIPYNLSFKLLNIANLSRFCYFISLFIYFLFKTTGFLNYEPYLSYFNYGISIVLIPILTFSLSFRFCSFFFGYSFDIYFTLLFILLSRFDFLSILIRFFTNFFS